MYKKRNTIYADAGKVLVRDGVVAYQMADGDCSEIDAPIYDMRLSSGIARWGRGMCAMRIPEGADYTVIKTKLIKLRYSNDDQLAVMLNADPAELDRMQRWRVWAADVAKAICARLALPC